MPEPSRERVRVLLGCAILAACGGMGGSTGNAANERAAVRSAIERIIAADNAGDLEAVIELYTEDAVLLPPGGEPIRGREAIREHYASIFAASALEIGFDSEETEVAGEWAFDRGTTSGVVRPVAGGPATAVHDKYLMVLRRDSAQGWRIARLIWNGSPSDRAASASDG